MSGRFVAIGSWLELQERHGEYLIRVQSDMSKIKKEELKTAVKNALLVSDVKSSDDARRRATTFHVSYTIPYSILNKWKGSNHRDEALKSFQQARKAGEAKQDRELLSFADKSRGDVLKNGSRTSAGV